MEIKVVDGSGDWLEAALINNEEYDVAVFTTKNNEVTIESIIPPQGYALRATSGIVCDPDIVTISKDIINDTTHFIEYIENLKISNVTKNVHCEIYFVDYCNVYDRSC